MQQGVFGFCKVFMTIPVQSSSPTKFAQTFWVLRSLQKSFDEKVEVKWK
jgi:hypothetical protein